MYAFIPRLILLVVLLPFLSGCASIGPSTVENDRFEYSSAIAESWKKMMLLNIVKLRYGDTPMFLEIGSIVNQYIMETEIEAVAGLRSGNLLGGGVAIGGKGKFADRPTITYSPLTGKKFSKSLLAPIPPEALFSLVQSGWSAEFILRVCLSAINDHYNSSGRHMMSREADEEFTELLKVLQFIQQKGGLGARLVERNQGTTIVFFRRDLGEDLEEKIRQLQVLLGLNPESSEFSLVYGSTAANDREIAMLTRSMLEITIELAQYVDVPEIHVLENRASRSNIPKMAPLDDNRSRVQINNSIEAPEDAFITIRYRGHWFFIADTDYRSKRMFSFLLFLFTLAETGSQSVAPVLTLPAG